jgi:hypothetical protein
MTEVISGVLSLVVGLIGSYVFLWVIYLRRPRVLVSDHILRGYDEVGGELKYRIKVINRTRAPLIDIHAQLHRVYRFSESRIQSKRVDLRQNQPLVIAAWKKGDPTAPWAYRFTADTLDIDEMNSEIRFRMICRHARSGASTLIEKTYPISRVIDGTFDDGDSLQPVRQT